jgi:hypothetical protein
MKFTIDIVRPNGRVMHRTVIEELNPTRAKTKAENLLNAWRDRGASSSRLLNEKDEEIYVLQR